MLSSIWKKNVEYYIMFTVCYTAASNSFHCKQARTFILFCPSHVPSLYKLRSCNHHIDIIIHKYGIIAFNRFTVDLRFIIVLISFSLNTIIKNNVASLFTCAGRWHHYSRQHIHSNVHREFAYQRNQTESYPHHGNQHAIGSFPWRAFEVQGLNVVWYT